MRDGDIDYSRYTLRELEEALAGINQHQFPENYANLCSAYARLKSTLETAPQANSPAIDRHDSSQEPRYGARIAHDTRREKNLEKFARRGLYSLVMGCGAFFAYFNSTYRWVVPPEYKRIKGAWLELIMPALEPYLPQIVIALGVGLVGYAAYCLYQFRTISESDE